MSEEILNEIRKSAVLQAKLDKIGADLVSAVNKAEEELYEVLIGNSGGNPGRKLAASIMLRGFIEREVDKALAAQVGKRRPIFP